MDEICEFCGKPCRGMWVDYGVGLNEFWGSVSIHKDEQYVSNCCEAPLNPPDYEEDFDIPDDYWEYE